MEIPHYNYRMRQDGAFTVIDYKKTPIDYKAAFNLLPPVLIPAGILAFYIVPYGAPVGPSLMIVAILAMAMSFSIIGLLNAFRKGGTIKISPDQIVVDSRVYPRNHISSIFIRTPDGEEFVYYHGSALRQLSQQNSQAFKRHFTKVRYKICCRFGASDFVMASGLSEISAEVLFDKIVEIGKFIRK